VIRLAIRVRRSEAELVLAELLELAPGGVEEAEPGGELVEFAVYGAPGELPELPELQAAAGEALVQISTSEIPSDWEERWKRFHRPVLLDSPGSGVPGLCVRPPWEAPREHPGQAEIVIDPGRAFGTGSHATTRLCLQLLLELTAQLPAPERGAAVDLGTGSGVLAIAAAKLGYAPVLALDNDPASIEAATQNALVNGVAIEPRGFDLRRDSLPARAGGACAGDECAGDEAPSVLLANLLAPLLHELAGALVGSPRELIAGGLLRGQADEVTLAFAQNAQLRERARLHEGDWTALWLTAQS
jgi:ribosomal protein L11 methyltransferase